LGFDDKKDPSNLYIVLQHAIQRRLDYELASLDTAPPVGPRLSDSVVDPQSQFLILM